METVKFKEFSFPHNPAVIRVVCASRVGSLFCPGYGDSVQYLGQGSVEVICSGHFLGSSAAGVAAIISDFEKKTSGGAGRLALPGRADMTAILAGVNFEHSGDGKAAAYTMRFIEADPALGGG